MHIKQPKDDLSNNRANYNTLFPFDKSQQLKSNKLFTFVPTISKFGGLLE